MAEYIDREEVINLLWLFADESCCSIVSDIENLPAADVAPVRHGRWLPEIEEFDDDPAVGIRGGFAQTGWKCSACGRHEPEKEPYCNCGAKMDGGGDNAAD